MSSTDVLTLPLRAGNALVSYVLYLVKMVWPVRLAVTYPHPVLTSAGLPAWQVVASGLLVTGITAVVLWQWKRRPYLLVGWFWYLVTLIPVVGLVQVGFQAMADRYTYVPLIGVFVAVAWGVPSLPWPQSLRRQILGTAAVLAVAASASVARRQVEHWRDSFTLFEHAIAVVEDNGLAWRNLGAAYFEAKMYARRSLHCRRRCGSSPMTLAPG